MLGLKHYRSVFLVLILLTSPLFATIVLNDGRPHEIDHDISEPLRIYDSPSGQPTTVKIIADITFRDVNVYGSSRFYMTAGTIHGALAQFDSSYIEVSGGKVDEDPFWLTDNALLVITGGYIDESFRAHDNSQIHVHGAGFTIGGLPVGYGLQSAREGTLRGALLNGGAIKSTLSFSENAALTLIPEPSALALLALAALRRRRRPPGTLSMSSPA